MGHNRKKMAEYQARLKKEAKQPKQQKSTVILCIVLAVIAVALIVALVVTLVRRSSSTMEPAASNTLPTEFEEDPPVPEGTPRVVMKVKDYGTIVMELYPQYAPKTVARFVSYVKSGFYNGLTFHRCISGFMIQGGDPTGTGYGLSILPNVSGEFAENNFYDNKLLFDRGVIGLARSQDYDSGTSQFFICHASAHDLDGKYAAFGKVVEGMDVVDAIANCPKTSAQDASGAYYQPKEAIIIESMYLLEEK